VLIAVGLYLTVQSRDRPAEPREPGMSAEEARAVLGVSAEADAAVIQAAWRRLMARAHPDQGGTEGLAARLNAARDRLLRK
jgi:DnaJ-domain-containing protein 1